MSLFGGRDGIRRGPAFDVVFYMPTVATILTAGAVPQAGGAERQVVMVATGLAARRWRVGLVSNHVRMGLPAAMDGVQLLFHRPYGGKGRHSRRVAYLREVGRMLFSVDAGALVQRSAGSTTGYVALAARLKRRRFVYSSASVSDFSFERLEPSRLVVRLFHMGVRLAGAVVVQTPEQVELCRERFGREPVMIKSMAEEQPLRGEEREAFLWVGSLAHYKRPEALVALARALPQAHFWVVPLAAGPVEGGGLEWLRAAEVELSNLELLAPRPRAELGELIARSVAVVNTSDYEGMPNVFLEGWARGVPALALNHDPDGVIEREGVGSFAGGSTERFAELAAAMWSERCDQREVAARCRDYIAREHSSERILDCWEDILELRSRTR